MAIFNLKRRPVKTLDVDIEGEIFKIPLGASLTPQEAAGLDTIEGTWAFVQKYLSDEVKQMLVIDDYNQIVKAWQEATQKEKAKTMGE